MTGLDLIAVQDSILIHIESAFPAYDIVEDMVLEDEVLLKLNKNIKPFIVLRWHGLMRDTNDTSFGGVRHDSYMSAVDVVFIAPSPKQARLGLNMVMDELIGWYVPGGSPLTPVGGNSVFPVIEANGRPHVYVAVNTLVFHVDSNGIGS
jgi:hypothetical protein